MGRYEGDKNDQVQKYALMMRLATFLSIYTLLSDIHSSSSENMIIFWDLLVFYSKYCLNIVWSYYSLSKKWLNVWRITTITN